MKRKGNYSRGKEHYRWTHGEYGTPLYTAWQRMRQRCLNPKNKRWARYGGRGITVCERWSEFLSFKEDMGATWFKGSSIERIDNNGNYASSNCKWIPFAEQAKNRSDTILVEYKGEKMCMRDWEHKLGFKRGTLRMRLRYYGWTVEQALTIKPKMGQKINI